MEAKKKSKTGYIFLAAVILLVVFLVRHFHIKNFHVIEPGILYTSGQPRGMDYTRLLYKYHIASIVNLRSSSEHREDNWYNEEITWVRDKGVNYFELPVDKNDHLPDKKSQAEFLNIMKNKENLPVLLHDSNGRKRVSMMAAVWLLRAGRYKLDDTVKTVNRIKERSLTEAERQFIRNLAEK